MNQVYPLLDGVPPLATDSCRIPAAYVARKAELRWQFQSAENLVEIVFSGHPTTKEWRAMMHAILADARYRRGFNFLFDKRECGKATTNEYAEASAEFYRHHCDAIGRCAIVLSDALVFGMSRMMESSSLDDRVRAFMDIQQARTWLGGGSE